MKEVIRREGGGEGKEERREDKVEGHRAILTDNNGSNGGGEGGKGQRKGGKAM